MRSIVFYVTETEKADLTEYAIGKGFKTAGDLARFAVQRYKTQYPLKTTERGYTVQNKRLAGDMSSLADSWG